MMIHATGRGKSSSGIFGYQLIQPTTPMLVDQYEVPFGTNFCVYGIKTPVDSILWNYELVLTLKFNREAWDRYSVVLLLVDDHG